MLICFLYVYNVILTCKQMHYYKRCGLVSSEVSRLYLYWWGIGEECYCCAHIRLHLFQSLLRVVMYG